MDGKRVVWAVSAPVAAVLIAAAFDAQAQNVLPAQMPGQPLVYLKDGRINGCGVRFLIVDAPVQPKAESLIRTYDVSFNLYLPVLPMVKAGSYDARYGDFVRADTTKARPVMPSSVWLKADGATATAPQDGKIGKSDDPGFFLYTTDLDPLLALFKAFMEGQEILVGARRQGETRDRVYGGVIAMKPAEQERVAKCVTELLASERK